MRADRARRLAALENRPPEPEPSAGDIALGEAIDRLIISHGHLVDPHFRETIICGPYGGVVGATNAQEAAVVIVDFLEAVEAIDPEASAQVWLLNDSFQEGDLPDTPTRRRHRNRG